MHQKPVCTETGACDRGRRRTSAAQPKQRAFKEAWNRDISAGKAGDDLRKTETDTTRPLLQCADPKEKISRMLLQRAPVYEEAAAYVVDVDDKSFEQIIKEIKEKTDETISH